VLSAATARRLALPLASLLAVGGAGAAIAVRTADASQRRDVPLSHAHWFVDGNTSLRIGPKKLATVVALRDEQLVVDRTAFRKLLAQRLRFPDHAAQNAQLRIVGERVDVAPGAPARSLDLQETVASLLREPAQQATLSTSTGSHPTSQRGSFDSSAFALLSRNSRRTTRPASRG
jgi:vancomycin resistance protein YoaR